MSEDKNTRLRNEWQEVQEKLAHWQMKAKELLSEENREKLQAEAAQKSSEWKNELTVQLAEVQKELQHWKTKAAALLEENKLEDFLDKAEDKLEDLQENAELAVEKLKLKRRINMGRG